MIWQILLAVMLVIVLIEILTGTIYLTLIAIAVGIGSLLSYFGVETSFVLTVTAISILGMTIGLKVFLNEAKITPLGDSCGIGDIDNGNIVVVEQILADNSLKVSYRGAIWQAIYFDKDKTLKEGDRARIVRKQNSILILSSIVKS